MREGSPEGLYGSLRPAYIGGTIVSERIAPMRAETETQAHDIQQSLRLLRRSL
jgi:hypothetical protein